MSRYFERLKGNRLAVSDEEDSKILEESRMMNEFKD